MIPDPDTQPNERTTEGKQEDEPGRDLHDHVRETLHIKESTFVKGKLTLLPPRLPPPTSKPTHILDADEEDPVQKVMRRMAEALFTSGKYTDGSFITEYTETSKMSNTAQTKSSIGSSVEKDLNKG